MPNAAGMQSTAIAQKVARQSSSVPSIAPPGTPAMVATVVPDSSTASARPFRSAGTSSAAVRSATARKPAFAKAAITRVASSISKLVVTAPTTCIAANARTKPSRLVRAGHRRASAAVNGAPTTIPTAKAERRSPAAPTDTSRLAEMSGRSPPSMNSEVPMANTATASRYSERGIGNSEVSKDEEETSRHRGRHPNARTFPGSNDCRDADLRTQGFRG